jgi:hypothetical protein
MNFVRLSAGFETALN